LLPLQRYEYGTQDAATMTSNTYSINKQFHRVFIWLSRDPIEESGGLNLYGAGSNDLINNWNYLGQRDVNQMSCNEFNKFRNYVDTLQIQQVILFHCELTKCSSLIRIEQAADAVIIAGIN
jgi:hypothetical protein